MNLLVLIEKAINEHGSSVTLRERLTAIKEELSKAMKERDDLKEQLGDAQKEIANLRKQVEKEDKKKGFVEYRGALFKRKVGGGYEPTVYCRNCHGAMVSLMGKMPYRCSVDEQRVDFTGDQLGEILEELEKEYPSK